MRDVAILTFMTLDGVMQGPTSPEEDPSGDFTKGGWAANYWGEVMQQVMSEAMSEPYDLLLGRTTYNLFAGHWPNESDDNPVAKILNGAKKFVATTAADNDFKWQNTTPISGDVAAEVTRLKDQSGPLLQVHGSHGLIQTLLTHNLIDEFRLWTFPILLGGGKRLFGDGTIPANLELVKQDATSNGVIMGVYRKAK